MADPTPASILVAATCRDDEPAHEPWRRFSTGSAAAGRARPPVGPLGLPDVEALVVGQLGGEAVEPELARRGLS